MTVPARRPRIRPRFWSAHGFWSVRGSGPSAVLGQARCSDKLAGRNGRNSPGGGVEPTFDGPDVGTGAVLAEVMTPAPLHRAHPGGWGARALDGAAPPAEHVGGCRQRGVIDLLVHAVTITPQVVGCAAERTAETRPGPARHTVETPRPPPDRTSPPQVRADRSLGTRCTPLPRHAPTRGTLVRTEPRPPRAASVRRPAVGGVVTASGGVCRRLTPHALGAAAFLLHDRHGERTAGAQ